MKRFALIVGVLAITASARAADDVEIKTTGEFRVRYENMMNPNGMDPSGQTEATTDRFKLNIGARKGEKLQAYLSVISGSTIGGSGAVAGGGTATNDASQSKYQDYSQTDNLLIMSRAWGWWKATDDLSFKVGRFGMQIADGLIFSENDWEAIPTAQEGLDAAWDTNWSKLHFYAIKQARFTQATAGNSDPEQNMYMLSFDFKNLPEWLKMGNLHIAQVNRDSFGAANTANQGSSNYEHIGLTVAGDTHNILYKLTAADQTGDYNKPNSGTDSKLSASMYDLMVGYQMPETMGLKVSLGYHSDSGNDTSTDEKQYQTMNYEMHGTSGLMDIVRWGNLTYYDLMASIAPAEDLETGLNYFMFSRTSSNEAAIFSSTYANFYNGGFSTDKALGSEVDLYAKKSYDGGLKMEARLGAFMPGSYLSGGTTQHNKTVMDAYLQASIGF